MKIKKYISQKKEIYGIILDFIENNEELLIDFQIFIDRINAQTTSLEDKELKNFLHLLLKISKNHYQNHQFYEKIEKIIDLFEEEIKQTFSNSEIFTIFARNKKILHYIFSKKIITPNKFINNILQKSDKNYHLYFYPEIQSFINDEIRQKIESELKNLDSLVLEDFEKYRLIGENDSYISELIRNDSIEEFVSYVNKTSLSLSKATIKPSLFETHSFLLKNKEPSLIEYAAFFGSIQIFQYLQLNNVNLPSSLWLFAIHSQNADFIHLLEELHVEPKDETYEEVFKEAIKCHHNDIANYINDNLLDQDVEQDNIEINYDENTLSYSFHYFNYEYFPEKFDNKFIFYYACQYDHYHIVEFLLKNTKIKINEKLIQIKIFLFLSNS